MNKYYHFIANKDLDIKYINDFLSESFKKHFSIYMFDKRSGYIIADESLYDRLETILPLINIDNDAVITFLCSHIDNSLIRYVINKLSKRNSGTIKHLSDFLLDLIVEGDDSFYPLVKQEFENVSRELIMTAKAFIDSSLVALDASKKLYVHRNTFSYRLDKFIEATNLDIRDYHFANYFLLASKIISLN